MTIDIDVVDGESATLDFKSSFDPDSKQDWCELIKDIVAMSNSGGGTVVLGVDDDGMVSNSDVAPLLAVDPADVTNRIYSYTDQHFAAFDIGQGLRFGKPVAVITVGPSRIPDCVHVTWRLCSAGRRPEGRVRQGQRLLPPRREE